MEPAAYDPDSDILLHESFNVNRKYYCHIDKRGKTHFYSTERLDQEEFCLDALPMVASDGAGIQFIIKNSNTGEMMRIRRIPSAEIKKTLPKSAFKIPRTGKRDKSADLIMNGIKQDDFTIKRWKMTSCEYEHHEWRFRSKECHTGTVYLWHDCEDCGAVLCEQFEHAGEAVTLLNGRKQKGRINVRSTFGPSWKLDEGEIPVGGSDT